MSDLRDDPQYIAVYVRHERDDDGHIKPFGEVDEGWCACESLEDARRVFEGYKDFDDYTSGGVFVCVDSDAFLTVGECVGRL